MDRLAYYTSIFLATAISASCLAHLSALSTELNWSASIALLLVVLIGVGAFVADDVACKWLGCRLEQLRFSLLALAVGVAIGLMVPQLPRLLEAAWW